MLLRDKLLQKQAPDERAEELGFYAVLGADDIPEKYIEKIKKIKTQSLADTFSKYLMFPEIPTVVVIPKSAPESGQEGGKTK